MELPKDGKLDTPIMTWIQQVSTMMKEHEMDTVFWIPSNLEPTPCTDYCNLLENWGDIMIKEIQKYLTQFTEG